MLPKQNLINQKFVGGKIVSPHQMLCLLRKNQHNRMWILKQLSQLGIDINLLQDYSLSQLYKHCDQIIKSTYSIKYLGMNQNQMGIISRRIDPFKDNNFNLKALPQSTYTVNKFFFPKPLKVGRKAKKQQQINIDNLQTQIKRAFLKNNPKKVNKENRNKVALHGSWINNYKVKTRQQTEDLSKIKHDLEQKLDSTHVKIEMPSHHKDKKNNVTSYSRFLSSGLVYTIANNTSSSIN